MHLVSLCNAMLQKSKQSLLLFGGPSSLWDYPERWDEHIRRARLTLVKAGVSLLPHTEAIPILTKMTKHRDGLHFENSTENREMLADALEQWIVPRFTRAQKRIRG